MSLTDTDVRTTHTATLPLCRPTPPPTILQYYLISKPCSVSPNCLKKVFLWLVYTDQNPSIIHPSYLANMLLNIFLSIKISPPFFFYFFLVLCLLFLEDLGLFLTENFLPSGLGWLRFIALFNMSFDLCFTWKLVVNIRGLIKFSSIILAKIHQRWCITWHINGQMSLFSWSWDWSEVDMSSVFLLMSLVVAADWCLDW